MTLASLLKQADIFHDLTPAQLAEVAAICEERRCREGELVFAENTPSHDMYVVAEGEVEIQLDPSLVSPLPPGTRAGSVTIATVHPGQVFGEIALVDLGLRSASARAVHPDTHLLVIPRDKLMTLCEASPEMGYRLMRNLAADLALKIRSTDIEVRAQLLWKPQHKS